MQTLNFAQAKQFIIACVRAGVTPCLVGGPGLGKTALANLIGPELGLPVFTLIGSNCDPTDIPGFPIVSGGKLERCLIPEIQAVCDAPGVLFIDEFTTCPPSVQAPLMRLILERKTQSRALHPESRIVVCMNPPDMCPGGVELSVATGNRIARINFCPSLDEVRGFFETLGDEDSALRTEALDFSATCGAEPGLVCFDPPRAAIETGAAFASPRAWELGLRAFVAHGGTEDDVGFALLAGIVGDEAATAYIGIKKLRKDLPSIEQIIADPINATVPPEHERSKQVAALGLLAQVVKHDSWAAWAYAGRLHNEIATACSSFLSKRPDTKAKSAHEKAGQKAQVKLLAHVRTTVLA